MNYYECPKSELLIAQEEDALRLMERFYPNRKVLIYQQNLSPDFFDLSTTLAGMVLQKFVNYGLKVAFVLDLEKIKSSKFKQMVREANTYDDYNFFTSRDEAVEWLESISD